MDDEYDLRKDNLGKEQREKFKALEKLIISINQTCKIIKRVYIHWLNEQQVIEAQLKKIVAITRGKINETK